MNTSSPLRYPGGKSVLAQFLGQVRRQNGIADRPIAEPFAGGAGASLTLLFLEETPEIFINDADRSIHDFWWTLVHRSQPFIERLSRTRVSMPEWRRQRERYRATKRQSHLNRGFAAFYLNRCNRSGIIMNGGPIGGVKQLGTWKLNARFNKADLRRRCQRIAEFGSRIHVSNKDGMEFIEDCDPKSMFFFIDPPYYEKGEALYLNSLKVTYHQALAERLRAMPGAAWILTYDDCHEVRRLYRGWTNIRPFSLRYSASERRSGNEVLIAPKWMRLPCVGSSASLSW